MTPSGCRHSNRNIVVVGVPRVARGTRLALSLAVQSALAFASDEPQPISVGADPNGIAYARGMLYVADAYSGAIQQIAGNRQRRIATVETGGVIANDRIGGIAVASHGILYVARLGYGQAGAIIRIERDGRMRTLPKLPPCWWRSGIVYDAREPALYTTQYMKSRSGAFDGGIVEIDLVTGEPSLVLDGFLQPVGIAKLGDMLVVTDARQRAVFRVERVAGRAVRRLQLASYLGRPGGRLRVRRGLRDRHGVRREHPVWRGPPDLARRSDRAHRDRPVGASWRRERRLTDLGLDPEIGSHPDVSGVISAIKTTGSASATLTSRRVKGCWLRWCSVVGNGAPHEALVPSLHVPRGRLR